MPWNMIPVKAPASAVKLPLDGIDADAKAGVEEALTYCQENPDKRLIVPFETEDERDAARVHIRSYCEMRPEGRLTASIWSGWSGAEEDDGETVVRYSQTETEVCVTPALSLAVRPYVKRDKKPATAESSNPPVTG